ncbi:MAG: hypothetical protein P9L92_05990 [Candidatus Electryonea clarkiae]|nr:hypothetical protein [Candidatus Electryonea clarkiae]MDP8288791.1 hypothetical protein [Candidatus Electryonea clarkiae]
MYSPASAGRLIRLHKCFAASVVLTGLDLLIYLNPYLKVWAKFNSPFGTDDTIIGKIWRMKMK